MNILEWPIMLVLCPHVYVVMKPDYKQHINESPTQIKCGFCGWLAIT